MTAGFEPIERSNLIVPDTGPLIHLAQTNALRPLHLVGGRIVVVDMGALDATQGQDKPDAATITAWIEAGRSPAATPPSSSP